MKCKAKTKSGTLCKFNSKDGSSFCHVHKSHRPTEAELEMRKLKISELLIEGKSKRELWRYASEAWGISERTLERYISDCTKQIKESANIQRREQFAIALEQLRDLYNKNYKAREYKECRLIIMAKLDLIDNSDPGEKQTNLNKTNIRRMMPQKNF